MQTSLRYFHLKRAWVALLLVSSVVFTINPAGAVGLDGTLGELLELKRTDLDRDLELRLNEVSQRAFLTTHEQLTVRDLIGAKLWAEVERWPPNDRAYFRWFMKLMGFPHNLNAGLIELFESHPEHVLFTPMSSLTLPPRFGEGSLLRTYGIHMVVDAVRAFQGKDFRSAKGPFFKKNGIEQFRALIESLLKRPIDEVDLNEDLAREAPKKPSCEIDLRTLTDEQFLIEFRRRFPSWTAPK